MAVRGRPRWRSPSVRAGPPPDGPGPVPARVGAFGDWPGGRMGLVPAHVRSTRELERPARHAQFRGRGVAGHRVRERLACRNPHRRLRLVLARHHLVPTSWAVERAGGWVLRPDWRGG